LSDLLSKYKQTIKAAIATMPATEYSKLHSVTWQSYSGWKPGEYEREGAKSKIRILADTKVHALQIIDLAQDAIPVLEMAVEKLEQGIEAEAIIERLLQNIRHEPESFDEMVDAFKSKKPESSGWLSSHYMGPTIS
jgi:hypothetical protein